jgi:hypothetical protein
MAPLRPGVSKSVRLARRFRSSPTSRASKPSPKRTSPVGRRPTVLSASSTFGWASAGPRTTCREYARPGVTLSGYVWKTARRLKLRVPHGLRRYPIAPTGHLLLAEVHFLLLTQARAFGKRFRYKFFRASRTKTHPQPASNCESGARQRGHRPGVSAATECLKGLLAARVETHLPATGGAGEDGRGARSSASATSGTSA